MVITKITEADDCHECDNDDVEMRNDSDHICH